MPQDLTDADRAECERLWRYSKDFGPTLAEQGFAAGLAAGRARAIEECAQWCEKNKGTACAEHCAPAVRALLK